jgi:hypothetical protein
MVETLLTASSIKLYGRVLYDLLYNYDPNTVVEGFNNFLQSQLSTGQVQLSVIGTTQANNATVNVSSSSSVVGLAPGMTVSATSGSNAVFANSTAINAVSATSFSVANASSVLQSASPVTITATGVPSRAAPQQNAQFARIYAFSFEGAIYSLPRPCILLVHGTGIRINANQNRSTMDQAGVAAREWEFSAEAPDSKGNPDFRYWEYEKGDFSIRLDAEAGPLEQILLVPTLRAGADMADRSRSGMSVSGMSVSGMSVSGMSVSGMSVSGMSVGGPSRSGR